MNDAAKNSMIAYRSIPDLRERQERILEVIRAYPNVSRNDIARITKMLPSNVSSRLCELVGLGAIVVTGKKRDRLTGRTVRTYALAEVPA